MKIYHLLIITVFIAFEAGTASFAEEESTYNPHYGMSAAVAIVPFYGGASGPTTPISETNYPDTFDTGIGTRLEIFYDWTPAWRYYLGGVYNKWEGKFFRGGEFPEGAQFDDFRMAGIYIGVKYRFNQGSPWRPYLMGNLGLVSLSAIDVTVDDAEIPYWKKTYRDYLDMGVGIEYSLTGNVAVFLDYRLELAGKPNSINFPIAEATGSSSFPITFGIDFSY